MAHDTHHHEALDTRSFADHAPGAQRHLLIAAAIGVGLALLGTLIGSDGLTRLAYNYVASFAYVLSIVLGMLIFVMVTCLFRAGWHVTFRRVAELFASAAPATGVMVIPILAIVLMGDGFVYPWAGEIAADHGSHAAATGYESQGVAHHGMVQTVANTTADHAGHSDAAQHDTPPAEMPDEATMATYVPPKSPFLNPVFFVVRWIAYLAIWTFLGSRFFATSVKQDATGDATLTSRLEGLSAPGILLFALTLTFAAMDLLMSLDPVWYSTMFGVYFFAGSMLSGLAVLILVLMYLQSLGYLKVVNTEHYHDLGKLLMAFVFFWGYIAYSQYMLIWYANLPETTYWFAKRGATTVPEHMNIWTQVSLILLVGHLLLPFAGLISRHVKRNSMALGFWAGWLLVMHAIDMVWLVRPEFELAPGLGDVFQVVGLIMLLGAGLLWYVTARASKVSLLAHRDPRIGESLRFHNT